MITEKNCGAVILAGGRSSRMGRNKALITINGGTLLAHLSHALSRFDEKLLSTNDPLMAAGYPLHPVADKYPNSGPMGGLHASLLATRKQALLCVPCDLPNFNAQAADVLLTHFSSGADALVCVDSQGCTHPLCGIYSRSTISLFEQFLVNGNYRMHAALQKMNCIFLQTADLFSDQVFLNLNTPEDLLDLATLTLPVDKGP